MPSGQAIAMRTNAPSRIATDIVLMNRAMPSGPSPTASLDDAVAGLSSAGAAVAVLAVSAAATVVVAASVAIVKVNEPLPPGVPSGLLTFQPTAHSPLTRLAVTGTVSVS